MVHQSINILLYERNNSRIYCIGKFAILLNIDICKIQNIQFLGLSQCVLKQHMWNCCERTCLITCSSLLHCSWYTCLIVLFWQIKWTGNERKKLSSLSPELFSVQCAWHLQINWRCYKLCPAHCCKPPGTVGKMCQDALHWLQLSTSWSTFCLTWDSPHSAGICPSREFYMWHVGTKRW